jgi:hypothetical protein
MLRGEGCQMSGGPAGPHEHEFELSKAKLLCFIVESQKDCQHAKKGVHSIGMGRKLLCETKAFGYSDAKMLITMLNYPDFKCPCASIIFMP